MGSDDADADDDASADVVAPSAAGAAAVAVAPSAAASPPRRITRLSESVVNRIAAGEIIHRPANALKELIENSLDAGADMIRITLRDGGLKMLQIQDNGHGVSPDDLPLLCERFATSKLRAFDDLSRMQTFGFRGEALASISFVSAQMVVVTKTRGEKTAWRAFYNAGALAPGGGGGNASSSSSSSPRPCAGTDGTTITAHDLFYNIPQRRRALKSASEEYNRSLDIVGKYALHYGSRGVGFVCKKAGSNATDLSTPSAVATTTLDTVRLLYGTAIARQLVHLPPYANARLGLASVTGYVSNANWSSKQRTTFLCFINNRLVDCNALKRALEAFYAGILPAKGAHPWVYLSLQIDAARVDVNVHPTKREVHFLDEEEVVEDVVRVVADVLAGANKSRDFGVLTQTTLRGDGDGDVRAGAGASTSMSAPSSTQTQTQAAYPQHQVRVDARTRTLDGMFGGGGGGGGSESDRSRRRRRPDDDGGGGGDGNDGYIDDDDDDADAAAAAHTPRPSTQRKAREGYGSRLPTTTPSSTPSSTLPLSPCTLTSIVNLRQNIATSAHTGLADILSSHTFVGVVDLAHGTSLIQHSTRLYLVNHDDLVEEWVYQGVVRQFGALRRVAVQGAIATGAAARDPTAAEAATAATTATTATTATAAKPSPSFSPPLLDVEELILLGIEQTGEVDLAHASTGLSSAEIARRIARHLVSVAEMLEEYFSIGIKEVGGRGDGADVVVPSSAAAAAAEGATATGAAAASPRIILTHLPSILPSPTSPHLLPPHNIPSLLLRLGTQVNWTDEEECFRGVARELGVAHRLQRVALNDDGGGVDDGGDNYDADAAFWRKTLQYTWFPLLASSSKKTGFRPSKRLISGDGEGQSAVVQLAALSDLYRIFERC